MEPDQVERLVRACRPKKFPPKFESGRGDEWEIWKAQFRILVRANEWDALTARRQIATSLGGEAAKWAEHVEIGDVAGVQEYETLLQAYDNIFRPDALGDRARQDVRQARQRAEENIRAWHARLRNLYRLAFPNIPAPDLEVNRDMIDLFVMGLINPVVKRETLRLRPINYQAARTHALNAEAVEDACKDSPGIFAMYRQQRNPSRASNDGKCFICESSKHFVRDCPVFEKAKKYLAARQSKGRGKDAKFGKQTKKGSKNAGQTKGRYTGGRVWNTNSSDRGINEIHEEEEEVSEEGTEQMDTTDGEEQGNEQGRESTA